MDAVIKQEVLRPVVGMRIAKLREAKGWTQLETATKLGISEQHLNRIEKAKASPGGELLYSFADLFGVPTDFLRLPIDAG